MSGLENFQSQVMAVQGSFLIDFWGPSCAPCVDLNRSLEAVEKDYKDRIVFVKVNADEEIDIATEFGVRGLPTLLLIHDGQIINRWLGMISVPALKSKLDKAILALG